MLNFKNSQSRIYPMKTKKTQIDSKLLIKVHQNTGYKTEGRIIRVLLVNTRDRFVPIITLKEEHVFSLECKNDSSNFSFVIL